MTYYGIWYDMICVRTVGPSLQEAIRCQGTLYVRSRACTIVIAVSRRKIRHWCVSVWCIDGACYRWSEGVVQCRVM